MFFIHWIIIICPTCKNLYFNCIHRSLHSNWDSILNNNLDWRDKNMSMHYSIEKHKHFLFNLLLFSLSLLLLLLLLPFPSVLFFSSNPLFFHFERFNHYDTWSLSENLAYCHIDMNRYCAFVRTTERGRSVCMCALYVCSSIRFSVC